MVRCIVSLFAIAMFAGCVADDPAGLALTTSDIPERVVAGVPFTFQLTGTGTATSTHMGAHYWTTPTNDPDADFGSAGGCAHVADGATFPATVQVTCTVAEAGTIQLRGHVRTEDGETVNHWAAPVMVEVVDFQLTAADAPTEANVGDAVAFTLTITGSDGVSDHIGAHYFDTNVTDPTAAFGTQAGACTHQAGSQSMPGTFTVSCTFTTAGTYYVFGHMRLELDGTHNFWADPFAVVVS